MTIPRLLTRPRMCWTSLIKSTQDQLDFDCLHGYGATVELLDFVEEGQAEALLAIEVNERNKKHIYWDTKQKTGNSYVRKEEWMMTMKHYDRGIKFLQEVSLANREEEEKRQTKAQKSAPQDMSIAQVTPGPVGQEEEQRGGPLYEHVQN